MFFGGYPRDTQVVENGIVGQTDSAGLPDGDFVGLDLGLPVDIGLAPVVEVAPLEVLFDVAQLVDDVQVQGSVIRRLAQVGQADGDGGIVVVYEDLIGNIRNGYHGARDDRVDLLSAGKNIGKNLTGTDVRKDVRQGVAAGFKPAVDPKCVFLFDGLTSPARRNVYELLLCFPVGFLHLFIQRPLLTGHVFQSPFGLCG